VRREVKPRRRSGRGLLRGIRGAAIRNMTGVSCSPQRRCGAFSGTPPHDGVANPVNGAQRHGGYAGRTSPIRPGLPSACRAPEHARWPTAVRAPPASGDSVRGTWRAPAGRGCPTATGDRRGRGGSRLDGGFDPAGGLDDRRITHFLRIHRSIPARFPHGRAPGRPAGSTASHQNRPAVKGEGTRRSPHPGPRIGPRTGRRPFPGAAVPAGRLGQRREVPCRYRAPKNHSRRSAGRGTHEIRFG
jgi:hypothetical protein